MGVELAAGLAQGHREPEPRFAGRGAQLDDPLGADRLGELAKQPAVGRRDVGVPLAPTGVLQGGEDPLLAVVLGQGRLARVVAPLHRPRAAAGTETAPAPRAARQLVGRQLAVLVGVALAELRRRRIDLGRRERAIMVGVEHLEQRVRRASPPRLPGRLRPGQIGPGGPPRSSGRLQASIASWLSPHRKTEEFVVSAGPTNRGPPHNESRRQMPKEGHQDSLKSPSSECGGVKGISKAFETGKQSP